MTLEEWTDIVARMSPDQRAAMAVYGQARALEETDYSPAEPPSSLKEALGDMPSADWHFARYYPGEATAAGEGGA